MLLVKDTVGVDQIQKIFEAQKANQYNIANTTVSDRKKKLKALKQAVEITYRQEIRDALKADFGKPQAEVDLTEIYPLVSECRHAIKHLSHWMDKQKVETPLAMMGSSAWYKYEPKGTCLIISPWNFPIQLCFGPMISAIAAGNTVILKPSENTPHTSNVIRKIIEDLFPENEIAVIEGAVETSTRLLDLPFNHIFFTGAPSIGKIVMAAAAKNLTSVTLELGGKSPTIVDETADIKKAAKRIAWGKLMNCGQICIAPDYVLIHESKKEEFVKEMKKHIEILYGADPNQSQDYVRVVNERHHKRLISYLEDSVNKGANVVSGGQIDNETNAIQPTLVTDVPMDSALMQEEIFGPILPIMTFKNINEALELIQSGEKPLALYIYSSKKRNVEYISQNTRAGGTCINMNNLHFSNNDLPFGGSNNSGIGKSHGFFGFQAFSDARSFYKQNMPGSIDLLMPPYNGLKEKIINLTIKYF